MKPAYKFGLLSRVLMETFQCRRTCVVPARDVIHRNRAAPGVYFFEYPAGDGKWWLASVIVRGDDDDPLPSTVVDSLLNNLRIPRQQFWRAIEECDPYDE